MQSTNTMHTFDKVLLIDDDEINNMLNANLIRKVGLSQNIDTALNGQEGLDYLDTCSKEDFPDLIFLDIHMPVMDGFEFLEAYEKQFKPHYGTIILMMLTTSVLESDRNKALDSMLVKEFINKPLSSEKLTEIIDRLELSS